MAPANLRPSAVVKRHSASSPLTTLHRRRHIYTLCPQQALQLGDSVISRHPQLLDVVFKLGILLLQVYDGLISFIESRCQSNHDAPLLQEEMLVPLYVHLIILQLLALSLKLIQFLVVLSSDHPLLLLQR